MVEYIAKYKPSESVMLLSTYGIKVPQPQSPGQIAKGLHYIMINGNDNDRRKILDLHPDKEFFAFDSEPEKTPPPAPEPKPPIVINNQPATTEPIIGVKVTYTLLGAAITLTTLALINWGINNIKPK